MTENQPGTENNEDELFTDVEIQEVFRIPKDRLGVVIGKGGSTKTKIEEITSTTLTIESESNTVFIKGKPKMSDPTMVWIARDMIKAIGRGFSERKAFRLIDPSISLRIITLEDSKNKRLKRLRGRIIGEGGKTRKIIEEITQVNVSVYGNTVSLIGTIEDMKIAQDAIQLLIDGSKHSTVYRFLEDYRQKKKTKPPELWQIREDVLYEKIKNEFAEKEKQESESDDKTESDSESDDKSE